MDRIDFVNVSCHGVKEHRPEFAGGLQPTLLERRVSKVAVTLWPVSAGGKQRPSLAWRKLTDDTFVRAGRRRVEPTPHAQELPNPSHARLA
jgi:hypothetical protein